MDKIRSTPRSLTEFAKDVLYVGLADKSRQQEAKKR
jgi:hypothetical protein